MYIIFTRILYYYYLDRKIRCHAYIFITCLYERIIIINKIKYIKIVLVLHNNIILFVITHS